MKIVIAGCGRIGGELAQQLSREGHSVTVIDRNDSRLEEMTGRYDILGVCGNAAALPTMREAGVETADLLIAATPSDEQNLLACLLARKLGTPHTIARVRDPEYTEQVDLLGEELGLSMSVNPESSTAAEIYRLIRFPSARDIEVFAGGRVQLVTAVLPEGILPDGAPLRDAAARLGGRVLICAVRRGDEVLIPNGSFVLRAGDELALTGEPTELTRLFREWGLLRKKADHVLLLGGGRIAYYLASQLTESGVRTVILEPDGNRCLQLSELLPNAEIIHGSGTERELLAEAGLHTADAVAALTDSDEENIILGMVAAESSGNPKVIVKVNNGNLIPLGEKAGLESLLSPKHLTANLILRYVRGMMNSLDSNVEALHSICGGKAEALEFSVGLQAEGVMAIPLKKLKLRPNILIAAIIRFGKVVIPGGNDVILRGDHVLIVTTEPGLRDLTDILA